MLPGPGTSTHVIRRKVWQCKAEEMGVRHGRAAMAGVAGERVYVLAWAVAVLVLVEEQLWSL